MSTEGSKVFPKQRSRLGGPLLFSLLLHGLLLWGFGSWLASGPGAVAVMVVELATPDRSYAPQESPPPKVVVAPDKAPLPRPDVAAESLPASPPVEAPPDETLLDPAGQEPVAASEEPVSAPSEPVTATVVQTRNRYLREISALIEAQKRYPLMARKLRQQGTVQVLFSLNGGGRVVACQVESSSGYRALDRAAREAVNAVAQFPPVPELLGAAPQFMVAIVFTLE